jgi:hypothetical protein
MNADGHRGKANELWRSIQKLASDPEENVVAIVELAFGMCHHLIASASERKYGRHIDAHVGVSALLRENGESKIAAEFDLLGTLRQGRFYGGKGDGPTVKRVLEIIDGIRRWEGQ